MELGTDIVNMIFSLLTMLKFILTMSVEIYFNNEFSSRRTCRSLHGQYRIIQ